MIIQKTERNEMNILQIPHLILKYIISHLGAIDKVCFILASRKWYTERAGFLTLPIDDMMCNPSDFNRTYIYMTSFIEQMHISNIRKNKPADPYYMIDQLSQLLVGIPRDITHLRFGPNFNEIITPGLIPGHVTHIHFGYDFNQELKRDLIPSACKFLQFGHDFNGNIHIGGIPESVEQLIFGYDFNQKLRPGMIPIGVKYLKLGDHFIQPLELGSLPQTITRLEFGYFYNTFIKRQILPANLTHLTFGGYFNHRIPSGTLPDTITHLKFGYRFSQRVERLPDSLEVLIFGKNYNYSLWGLIPKSTYSVELGAHFNVFAMKTFGPNVKYLRFSEDNEMGYTQVVPTGFLISAIETLSVPTQFFQHNSLETISSHIKNIIIEKEGDSLHIRYLSKDYALAMTKNVIGGFISTKYLHRLVPSDIMTTIKTINTKLFK